MTNSENPNLRPNGKRGWSPRRGLTHPLERANELWAEEQENSNNGGGVVQSRFELAGVQPDDGEKPISLHLDHADRVDDMLKR